MPGLSGVVSLAVGPAILGEVGHGHVCVLMGNGTVQCWGANDYGQLGDGTTTSRVTPAPVPGLSGVQAVAVGGFHTCALMADNSIDCWGDNSQGQLGDGTTAVVVATPQPVQSGFKFSRIACGAAHTCATLTVGSVFCWGANYKGQLGDGTTTQRLLPTQILASGSMLAAFEDQSCVASGGGAVRCWGGFLGYNSYANTPTLTGVNTADAIAPGGSHACAIVSDTGALECWGANDSGQLGDGTLIARWSPVPVVWP